MRGEREKMEDELLSGCLLRCEEEERKIEGAIGRYK